MSTTTIHTHIAVSDEKGIYAVKRDDKLMLCPKLMFPQVGQQRNELTQQTQYVTNISRLPCSTECPFAQLKKVDKAEETDEDKYEYEISCEGHTREIILDEVQEFKKEPPRSPLEIVGK